MSDEYYPTAWAYEQACSALNRHKDELKEAKDIIRTFLANNIAAGPLGLCDEIDNDGEPYQSQDFADLINRASTFLNKDKPNG